MQRKTNPNIINIPTKNSLGTPLRLPKSKKFARSKNPAANIMNQTIVLWIKFFLKDKMKLLTTYLSSSLTIFINTEYKAVIEAPIVMIGIQKSKNIKFKITRSIALDKNPNNRPSKLNK
jgi:hypothetical protein